MATELISLSSSCSASGSPAQLLAAIDNIYGTATISASNSPERLNRTKTGAYPASSRAFGKLNNEPIKHTFATIELSGSVALKPVEIYAPAAVVASDGGPLSFQMFIDSLHSAIQAVSNLTQVRISGSKLVAMVGAIVPTNSLFEIFPSKFLSSSSVPAGSLVATKLQTFSVDLSSSITVSSPAISTRIIESSIFDQFCYFFHRRHHRS